MNRCCLSFLLLFLLPPPSGARKLTDAADPLAVRGLSIGIKAGLSDLWGDVGTKTIGSHYFNGSYFSSTHYIGGIMARYSITRWLSVRLEASGGTIYASDTWNRKDAARLGPGSPEYNVWFRNQDARTTIFEAALNAEIMPLRFFPRDRKVSRMPLQPVLVAGFGVFHFNPETSYIQPSGHTIWVSTQPLHLEAEGLNYPYSPPGYKLTQICVPVGIGLRYEATQRLAVGFEYLLRYTPTDYLDGVSNKYVSTDIYSQYLDGEDAAIAAQVVNKSKQLDPSAYHPAGDIRGNPGNKDWYSTLGFHVAWRLLSRTERF